MKAFDVNGATLTLALFVDVSNSKELLGLMQAGTIELEVALLNASLIPDVYPVLASAHKTLVSKSRESLTTRTLQSELVYNYSGSKHISESMKQCGISGTSTCVIVARFGASTNEVRRLCHEWLKIKDIEKLIRGKEIHLAELEGKSKPSPDTKALQNIWC